MLLVSSRVIGRVHCIRLFLGQKAPHSLRGYRDGHRLCPLICRLIGRTRYGQGQSPRQSR
jgi:hypothetical protein